jgi:glycosyltransferase involved in cell wall biosynthesis
MVGTIEPRKGHIEILDAFQLLWEDKIDCNLVVVGRGGWGVNGLLEILSTHPEVGKRLIWIEHASDEYLDQIYSACCSLIAASYGEGFGLPLIEAAQRKLPIIARDIPVFREVAGEDAYFFSGSSAQIISTEIVKWLKLYKEGRNPNSEKIHYINWQESARQLFDILISNEDMEN